ncbi:MAG: cobyric acid synthase CobQ [Desulfobacterales bacterium]|nr:MAG: cobyric acid synthase CobQ [Desulfobacterales bacterium]
MVQGTASNAGKSVLVAGFCRILMQDGYDVAPFKAQNMSLNSFVTHDGLEMGRAQVVQAQAARLPPDVRMNPVLLKPNSDVGSQIIVQGTVVGNMNVSQYVKYKQEAGRIACRCYDSLAAEHDVILLEGAGSPGEVNLKQHDIVNMTMARYAHAPVLLVGDIDRGGVYASFVGTMEVLDEWERKLIRGFLVNRFRGDSRLLTDAHFYVKEHTGVDVIGTIPYLKNLGIPEEDSVSFKSGYLQQEKSASQIIEIVLISLPHISNLNDIEPFFAEPDVYLKIVDNAGDIGEPDAIILPGSKNVFADRAFLVESGIASVIVKNAQRGCEIVGICGGYQLLGKRISDPASIESDNQTIPCLDLLEIETTLAKEKTRVKKSGIHTESNLAVEGYEIHHGLSDTPLIPVFTFADGSSCGSSHPHKNVWGAYLHGLFDADLFRRYWIDSLRTRKGYSALAKVVAPYDLEAAFDRLADAIRESVDMKAIYRIIEKHDT